MFCRSILIDGQLCDVFVEAVQDPEGTWHDVLLFRRGGRVHAREFVSTGVDWHLPAVEAAARAAAMEEVEIRMLLERALRTRDPLV